MTVSTDHSRIVQILDPKCFTLGQVLYYPNGDFIGRVEYVTERLSTAALKFEVAHCRTPAETFVEVSQFALVGKTVFTREGLRAAGLGRNPSGLPPIPPVTTHNGPTPRRYVLGKGARIFRQRELALGYIDRIISSDMEPGGLVGQTNYNNIIRPSQLSEGHFTHGARKHND